MACFAVIYLYCKHFIHNYIVFYPQFINLDLPLSCLHLPPHPMLSHFSGITSTPLTLTYKAPCNLNLSLSQTFSPTTSHLLTSLQPYQPSVFKTWQACSHLRAFAHVVPTTWDIIFHLSLSQHSGLSSNVISLKLSFLSSRAKVAHSSPHPSCSILLLLCF